MRIIVGVTGTTGVEMSYELLLALRRAGCEVHLIISRGAQMTWDYESRMPLQRMYDLANFVYQEDELDAVISSGSFVTDGMILMPCSMKTLAGIVAGYAETLILRAADVCLKEGRKVVLVPREMPLGKIHLRNLKEAADCGCAIVPPMLTFYNGAETVREQVRHVVGKVLLQFGIDYDKFVPWKNEKRRENVKNRDGGTEVRRKTEGVLTSDCAERQTAAVRRRFTHRLSFSQIEIQATRVGCDIQLLLRGGSSPSAPIPDRRWQPPCDGLRNQRHRSQGRGALSLSGREGCGCSRRCDCLHRRLSYRRDDAGTDSGSAGGCEAYGTGSEGVGGWKRRLMGERMKYTAIIADGWEVLIIWCEDFSGRYWIPERP